MRPTLREAQDILKVLREAIQGLSWAEEGNWFSRDKELERTLIVTIMETITVVDLFLTGEIRNRAERDAEDTLKMISGIPWVVSLSDGKSTLLVQRATEQNPEVVSLQDASPDVNREWKRLNVRRSQATEFRSWPTK
jgi:hypothetical protein